MSYLCYHLKLYRNLQVATSGVTQNIAADLFEAYIGALHRDTTARGHPQTVRKWLEKVSSPEVFPELERRGRAKDAARESAAQVKPAYVKQKDQQCRVRG
jgi:dsRNA-specific ribonuclease